WSPAAPLLVRATSYLQTREAGRDRHAPAVRGGGGRDCGDERQAGEDAPAGGVLPGTARRGPLLGRRLLHRRRLPAHRRQGRPGWLRRPPGRRAGGHRRPAGALRRGVPPLERRGGYGGRPLQGIVLVLVLVLVLDSG